MTAEVIILNASGVALAADSAVTIGGTKIYNTAIKLMALSKTEPVGVMVFGSAGIMGVPWETLIKVYRKQLRDKRFDVLEDYSDDFLRYLISRSDLFPADLERRFVGFKVFSYYTDMRESLLAVLRPAIDAGEPASEEQVMKTFEGIIDQRHEFLKDQDFANGMDEAFEKSSRAHYVDFFKEVLEAAFQNLKPKKSYVTKLYDIAVFIHTRAVFSRSLSGLVFAGYGDKEIFPSVANYEIESFFQGRLKYRFVEAKSKKITESSDAGVYPFAQEDMVNLFMNGVNNQVLSHMQTSLDALVARIPDLINDDDLNSETRSAAEIKDALSLSLRAALGSYYQDFGQHIRDEHITPVINMVRVLPKDELAAMAEALVNLTAFKRKMTNTLETVGGPIDVAVISKGDGLVWVKRKHYFPPELNTNFYQNYFRGIDNE